MKQGSTCIVNAASERDMGVFAAGMIKASIMLLLYSSFGQSFTNLGCSFHRLYFTFYLQAEMKGKRYLCRTAASFVSSRVGIVAKAPILPKDLGINKERNGGLIVVGSYVPKTTKQVGLAATC